MRSVVVVTLTLVLLLSSSTASRAKKASETLSRARLAETAELFFGADPAYRSGDLLVRSQVASFQDYLRKTQGASSATRSQLLRKIEPDNSRLASVFFSKGGRSTLRVAAQELGGYGPLVRYCRTKRGLRSLQKSVKRKQVSQLVEQISAQEAKEAQKALSKKTNTRTAFFRSTRIYTEKQLLDAMLAPSSSKSTSSSTPVPADPSGSVAG